MFHTQAAVIEGGGGYLHVFKWQAVAAAASQHEEGVRDRERREETV